MAQKTLADTVSVSGPWLSRVEHGHVWPSDKLLREIARALEVDATELLDRATGRQASNEDQQGRLIAEQLKGGIGDVDEVHEGPWDRVAEPVDRRHVVDLVGREKLARWMISLLPDPDNEKGLPDDGDAGGHDKSILICRYSTMDVLRVAPDALRSWERRLQLAMDKGWNVVHLRSEAAWAEEMRHAADRTELGGPISLLNRLGFKGKYEPYSVPASADRAARLAHLDVPDRGTLLIGEPSTSSSESNWHGCFVPPTKGLSPLRRLLRHEALDLVALREALVTQEYTKKAGALDRGLQQKLYEIERVPGDQILIKIGLNVVLQPTELWSTVVERLVRHNHLDNLDQVVLQEVHKLRRELFFKNVRSSKFMDVCPRTALERFAATGRFQQGSDQKPTPAEEPIALTPSERGRFLEAVVTVLDDYPKYQLAVVNAPPFDIRCHAKDSDAPVVCIETPYAWAVIREPTFCKSLLTYLRLWYTRNATDRSEVRAFLLDLAKRARRAEPSAGSD